MNAHETDLVERLHALADGFDMPLTPLADDVSRGRRRVRRNRAATLIGTVAAAAVVVSVVVVSGDSSGRAQQPVTPGDPDLPSSGAGPNGWVALDAYQGDGDLYLVRPGVDARRLEVPGSAGASDACPAWSPDGTRLMFGRLTGHSGTTSGDAELVIVPVRADGTAGGAPTRVPLDGFGAPDGFAPHPCGTWAPDGRWVALRGPGDVWVVDTQTGAIRRLPDLRPIDMEWRPGTDELTIAGDMGMTRAAEWRATPVTVYSVSTGERDELGSFMAGNLTWSPDGSTLAYEDGVGLRVGLSLVDGDGTNERVLVDGVYPALHGIGPVWSPGGDRIAYQTHYEGSREGSQVMLVSVADGTETVIEPPKTEGPDGPMWFPFTVTWSPDGTTLLYTAWTDDGDGVISVPADMPGDVTVLTDFGTVPGYSDHRWARLQMWGAQLGR